LHAQLGLAFCTEGLGHNWTHCFVQKHHDRIKTSWATPLEEKQGQGTNPHANVAWWKLLGDTLTMYNIKPENIYGIDEVGIQPQGGKWGQVIGGCKKAPQYQQHRGTHENITVLVTICADGTSQAPAIIFKGGAFQVKWKQNNPLNTS
jgi:glycine cleavage system protein P-like pyridoxal-binding family